MLNMGVLFPAKYKADAIDIMIKEGEAKCLHKQFKMGNVYSILVPFYPSV